MARPLAPRGPTPPSRSGSRSGGRRPGSQPEEVLRDRLDPASYEKLAALGNERLWAFVAEAVELLQPDSVLVAADDPADLTAIRDFLRSLTRRARSRSRSGPGCTPTGSSRSSSP